MAFSLQKYLLYYINANNEESEAKSDRDINIGAPYILGSVSVFLLVYLLGLPLIYYIISAIFVLITYLMNNYKSTYSIYADFALVIFLLVYLFLFNNPFNGISAIDQSLADLYYNVLGRGFISEVLAFFLSFIILFIPSISGEAFALFLSFIIVVIFASYVGLMLTNDTHTNENRKYKTSN